MILPESLEGEIAAMTTDEKRELARALMRMVAEELAGTRVEPGRCPLCGHRHIVRKGRGAGGSQRWLCRGCGRTFGATTMRVIAQSKLGRETWLAYAEGMADGLTLRELAGRCGVCLKTSWFMRMRICEAMGSSLDGFASGPGVAVEVDDTALHESFAGNNGRGAFLMPRARHKSYGSLRAKGISGLLSCVLCAANDRGQCVCELVGRAHPSAGAVVAALGGRLLPGTPVATDGWRAYAPAMRQLGCAHEVRPSEPGPGEPALGMVNALHKRLDGFLRPFNGVATRRLQRYLDWFCWTEQFRGGDADRRELVSREVIAGAYETTRHRIFEEPRFRMGYWEERGWHAA